MYEETRERLETRRRLMAETTDALRSQREPYLRARLIEREQARWEALTAQWEREDLERKDQRMLHCDYPNVRERAL